MAERSRRILAAPLTLVVLVVLAGALLSCGDHGDLGDAGDAGRGVESGPGASASPSTPPPARRVAMRPGAPRELSIPSLGVSAQVVSVGLRGSTLVPPSDPDLLGWWAGGAMPGAVRGSALIAGHTVHTGGGALEDLEEVRPGADVVVGAGGQRLVYRVASVRVLDKDAIARTSQRLFSQEAPGRLVLLTCEDWDGTTFRSNVVVTAVPRTRP